MTDTAKSQTSGPLNSLGLTLTDAAAILKKVSSEPVTTDMLEGDIDAGAPANPDGTLNLVSYTA